MAAFYNSSQVQMTAQGPKPCRITTKVLNQCVCLVLHHIQQYSLQADSFSPSVVAPSQILNYILIQILLHCDRLQFVSQWHLFFALETLWKEEITKGELDFFQSSAKSVTFTNYA